MYVAMRQVSSRPFAWARPATMRHASLTMPRSENSMRSRTSFSASIFEKSRMSLMIVSSASPEVRTITTYSRCSRLSSVSRVSSVSPMMAFIGVRISWLTFARNSLFARLVASAASLARSRCAATSRRSVTSCSVPTMRSARPDASRAKTLPRTSIQRHAPLPVSMRSSRSKRSLRARRLSKSAACAPSRSSGWNSRTQDPMSAARAVDAQPSISAQRGLA